MSTASSPEKPSILIQLDTDPHPSVFDRVVAIDAGVDQLFAYGGVKPEQVRALVHGAIFTRSPRSLHRTAVFIGGSDVAAGEAVLGEVLKAMIPGAGLRVSVMLDPNGSNTTAAAAVCAAARHLDLNHAKALVLGGTGPVGQRVARLLARRGTHVRIGSRQADRAEAVCRSIRERVPGAKVEAVATASSADGPVALAERDLVIAAGAAGATLLPRKIRATCGTLRVAIDLNAVPPAGIEGIEVTDKAAPREGLIAYGAIGVGETKMKIHRAAIEQLFRRNDQVLDAEEIYELALRV
ncbi:MAG TPA: NADP-dependent methylenetetrahydromethanopterin/methylenetetrahydrofolate dehydrogenase [Gemmataceae bacterium]